MTRRNHMRVLSFLAIVAACLLLGATAPATGAQQATDGLSETEVLGLVRRINTAEANVSLARQPYATLRALSEQKILRTADGSSLITLLDDNRGRVKDYSVLLLISADGLHYAVSVVPQTGCSLAAFSNEHGVIYTGQPLGCAPLSR
jgi:hypothetical protein